MTDRETVSQKSIPLKLCDALVSDTMTVVSPILSLFLFPPFLYIVSCTELNLYTRFSSRELYRILCQQTETI
jgi:hypothetical protein